MERKSFLLYTDKLDVLDDMSDEDVGKLFRAIVLYVAKGEEPGRGTVVSIAFRGIKNGIDFATDKYEALCQIRREAGKKGGAPRGNKNASKKQANGCFTLKNEEEKTTKTSKTNITDTDTDTDIKEITTPFGSSNRENNHHRLPISSTEEIELSEIFIVQLRNTYPDFDIPQVLKEIRLKLVASNYPCYNELQLNKYVATWFRNLRLDKEKENEQKATAQGKLTESEAYEMNKKIRNLNWCDI